MSTRWSSVIAALAAVGLVGAAGCGDSSGHGACDLYANLGSTTMELNGPLEPPMRLNVESCRRDADVCQPLCDLLMQRHEIYDAQISCEVSFHGDDVSVKVVHVDLSDCLEELPLPAPDFER